VSYASLPSAPSMEQLRKQAKELLRAHRAGDPGAAARVAAHHPHPEKPLKLAGTQLVVAREHGFPSWARLRAYVERIAAYGPDLEHAYHEDLEYYEGRAYGLLASAQDGTPRAVAAFESTDPPTPATKAGARALVARRHGFETWAALRRHVAGLRDSGEPFARAYRAIEAHDVDGLRAQLETFPDLAAAVGTNGNDLLGMAGATCDERLVRVLLDAGADPTRGNAHGWTPLHQAAYSNLPLLARMLLDEGVPVDVSARGDGGTPLVIALFWGHREVTEVLAEHGVHPRNLRAAAGLGRLDLVEELVAPDGRLAPDAGAHRAYYRPHSGFPDWRPSDDPQEVLDEALAWAARSDRVEVLEPLVARAARPDADVYRGSALMWAAATGRTAAVRRLIELGANPSGRSTFGGPTHGEGVTPLHLAAQDGHLETVRALLAAGADATARDANFGSTPDGWAEYGGHPAVAAAIRGA
jgi:ankyrin repeat protein